MSLKFHYHTQADTKHNSFTPEYLGNILNEFKAIIDNPNHGFFHLTDNFELINQTKSLAKKFESKKHFVQIGIGGSALGPQMLISALGKNNSRTFSLFDNVDSDYIQDQLDKIDIKETLFYVVSKSGGTAETLACYAIARNELLKAGVSEADFNQYFVFCTENKDSELMNHIKENNFNFLEVPLNIGGRFSVLSPVGLFPALFFDIDIESLYAGANKLKENLLNSDTNQNDLLQTAAHTMYLFLEEEMKVNQTVLMPYSTKLKDLSYWFVQLWAESLGKWCEAKNQPVGLTPIPAYGATDQHSQMQLFMEGPQDKLLFLLKVNSTQNKFELSNNLPINRAQELSKFDLNQLMLAEFNGTLKALKENKRNVIEIELDTVSAQNLGGLILFFESLTALMGYYLSIDPFNQPGVEKGKIYTFEFLNNL